LSKKNWLQHQDNAQFHASFPTRKHLTVIKAEPQREHGLEGACEHRQGAGSGVQARKRATSTVVLAIGPKLVFKQTEAPVPEITVALCTYIKQYLTLVKVN
jgi:hypothetical protein